MADIPPPFKSFQRDGRPAYRFSSAYDAYTAAPQVNNMIPINAAI
jgi:hypothetical protein